MTKEVLFMKLNVVLYNPEIPQNTGNIMRTCVGTNCKLHLIEPLGFKVDSATVKRCGVNYLDNLDMTVYPNWDDFVSKNQGTYFFMTRYGHKPPSTINFKDVEGDIYLIFGKESTGIPYELLANHLDNCFRLPMTDKVRSLNLSNCVAIVLYEALRQLDYLDLLREEPESMKGKDFLNQFITNKE